jgi:hypothetical protein
VDLPSLREGVVLKALLLPLLLHPVHDFYERECCSDRDCAPLELAEVPREVAGGFQLPDGRHIPYATLRPSPDGRWHLCEVKSPAPKGQRKLLCVYAPIGGV